MVGRARVADRPWSVWVSHGIIATVCGIAGLFAKAPEIELDLGSLLAGMLEQLADRGPDSTASRCTATRCRPARSCRSWLATPRSSGSSSRPAFTDGALAPAAVLADHGDHAVLHVDPTRPRSHRGSPSVRPARGRRVRASDRAPQAAPAPRADARACGIRALDATHGIGHTRMATESRVTTAGSHPFSTGDDLCLVHNGSLSNHNRLRRELRRARRAFATENDSEVAAGYLMWRLREGDRSSRRSSGAAGPRRLLHVRGRDARRLRRAARPDRLQAGRDGRNRRMGRHGVRVPRDRDLAGSGRRRDVGARTGPGLLVVAIDAGATA